MKFNITILHHSLSFGTFNPFECTKPIYIKFKPFNKYGYNMIINLLFVYVYYCNLRDV